MFKKKVQHIYSKQIHDTQIHDTYREAILLNVFYKNIHSYNIYSKQCDIDIIINELSWLDKYATGILTKTTKFTVTGI